jgi:hypothetical protein
MFYLVVEKDDSSVRFSCHININSIIHCICTELIKTECFLCVVLSGIINTTSVILDTPEFKFTIMHTEQWIIQRLYSGIEMRFNI